MEEREEKRYLMLNAYETITIEFWEKNFVTDSVYVGQTFWNMQRLYTTHLAFVNKKQTKNKSQFKKSIKNYSNNKVNIQLIFSIIIKIYEAT